MKRIIPMLLAMLLLAGCGAKQPPEVPAAVPSYTQIDQETARTMMEEDDGHVIVDVRRQDEYDAGHIPGAILIPNESITDKRPEVLPDLDQIILVYCRSGNRSKQASEKLAALGYTNIYEFGGINTWTGEIVTEEAAPTHTVTLWVDSNPTTGFSWIAEQDRELFEIQDEYTADPREEPVAGSGGVQKFTLTPLQSGTVCVTFIYTRSWEPSDTDTQFTCVFEIDEDFEITVVDDGKSQTAGSWYGPQIKID